jgi:23S rRNA (guanosine2251-2'-O)-methyltransferase
MKSNVRFLILHDIRSAQNVGSLFRTADAVGITGVYLSTITPAPIDRFGRARSDVAKTALGAERSVEWEMYENIDDLIARLKSEGVHILAIEQSPYAVDYKQVIVDGPIACIVGNEVGGIPEHVLARCDTVAQIPMHGKKESLNVAVAAGIALFRMFDI